ncbi:MAG: TadE/TadG family type IV pilus assembly protein [Xanthobacteraceae bacterium]
MSNTNAMEPRLTGGRRAGRFGLRCFLRRKDGSAAVEFALVAAPFLALLFAIMETALIFFAGQTLETAAADAGRLILTGQAQTQGLTKETFKEEVCDRIFGLFDCQNGIYVDVKKYANFASVDLTKPLDEDGNLDTNFTYDPGGPCEIVVVRLLYAFPVYVSLLGFNLADMAGGKRLLVATSVFRNEPYQGSCS